MRQERYHRRSRSRKKKTIWAVIITILLLLVLGVVFFFPINNTVRNISGGNDTPSDKVVKSELIKKVDSTKNGDPSHDKKVDKAMKALRKTKMADIIQSASDRNKAAKILSQNSSLSESQANTVAKKIFSDSKYDNLRQAVGNGNWYSVYQQYKTLSNDGSLTDLKNSIDTSK